MEKNILDYLKSTPQKTKILLWLLLTVGKTERETNFSQLLDLQDLTDLLGIPQLALFKFINKGLPSYRHDGKIFINNLDLAIYLLNQ